MSLDMSVSILPGNSNLGTTEATITKFRLRAILGLNLFELNRTKKKLNQRSKSSAARPLEFFTLNYKPDSSYGHKEMEKNLQAACVGRF